VFAGLILAMGLFCGVSLAQNAQRDNQGTQPGAAGQKQADPAGQGQFPQGRAATEQAGQQAIAGQAAGQAGQPQQGQSPSADQQIAVCVHGECSNEIEIAKFVEPKLQTEEAREFAQRMVREHSPGCQEMHRLAGNLASSGQTGGQATQQGGHLDWISIKKQIGQQCLTSVKQELGSKQGIDLDKCFMGQQIGAHMKVVDELKVLRNYASAQLRETLDKELQMAQTHLQQAKQIEQQLKDRPSERVSRRPESK